MRTADPHDDSEPTHDRPHPEPDWQVDPEVTWERGIAMLGDHQTFVRRRGVLAIERAVSYTPARQEAAEHVLGEFVATHRRRWWRNDEAVREATRVLRGKPRFGLAAELRSTRWSTGDFTAQEWLMIAVFVAMTVVLVAALVIRL